MSFRAPYLSKDDLRQRAERFLADHNPTRAIPVPIEFIVESRFDMDIVPVPGLQAGFDVQCLLGRFPTHTRSDC